MGSMGIGVAAAVVFMIANASKISGFGSFLIYLGGAVLLGAVAGQTMGSLVDRTAANREAALQEAKHAPAAKPGEAFVQAMRDADLTTMRRLLETGTVSPTGQSDQGRGWLQYATQISGLEQCKVLLAAGASPSAKDGTGTSAYDEARNAGNEELVALFRAAPQRGPQPLDA